jgi:aminoglycoside phosphotransferase (APT) family kinase protein
MHDLTSAKLLPVRDGESIRSGAEPNLIGPLLAEALYDERWKQCSTSLITGGMSNLTYLVRSTAGEVIFRRPPLGHVLPTAHDMRREYRAITALTSTPVPVPRTIFFAEAGNGLDCAAFAMERVLGHVCRHGFPDGYAELPEQRRAIGHALVDALADLHLVRPDAVGLYDFGRPEGFTERQLRRWSTQWEKTKISASPTTDLERLRVGLEKMIPAQRQPGVIVHGDYRLDNTVLHPAEVGKIVAVLDWEMSTLGDPLTDLGGLLAYWAEAGDDEVVAAGRVVPPITASEGFPTRRELVERYALRTGFDVSAVDWYLAFAYFKISIICQGIAARHAAGATLGDGFGEALGRVAPLIEAGLRTLDRLTQTAV